MVDPPTTLPFTISTGPIDDAPCVHGCGRLGRPSPRAVATRARRTTSATVRMADSVASTCVPIRYARPASVAEYWLKVIPPSLCPDWVDLKASAAVGDAADLNLSAHHRRSDREPVMADHQFCEEAR